MFTYMAFKSFVINVLNKDYFRKCVVRTLNIECTMRQMYNKIIMYVSKQDKTSFRGKKKKKRTHEV